MRHCLILSLLFCLACLAGCPVKEDPEKSDGVILKPAGSSEEAASTEPAATDENATTGAGEEDPLDGFGDLIEILTNEEPTPADNATESEAGPAGGTDTKSPAAADSAQSLPGKQAGSSQADKPAPAVSGAAADMLGYWAVAASCHNGVTTLNQRTDTYAFELDELGNATQILRLVDGRVLRLPGTYALKSDQLTLHFAAEAQDTMYRLASHSKNLRILSAADGTQLYLVRLDPKAPPAEPDATYQSSTFTISFSGDDGFYIGSFAGGDGQLAVYSFGLFLVGEFERSEGRDKLNGYVILELSPGRFEGPYWTAGSNEFSADWIGNS